MKRVLIGLLFLIPTMVQAATPSERVEQFLQQVTTSQSDQAIDQLLAGSGFAKHKPQEVAEIKNQTFNSMLLAGKPIGFEKVLETDLSPSIKRLVYVHKFEMNPGIWEFYFYKPHDEWLLNTINYTEQISSISGLSQ